MKFPSLKISFSWEKLIKLWFTKWPFGIVVAVLSAFLAILLSLLPQFESLELKTYDIRFAIRGEQDVTSDNIVIVAIDDATFTGLQMNWPFPRSITARAIANLFQAGARMVLVDIDFAEPSSIPGQDELLAAIIQETGNVVLAGKIATFSEGETKYEYPIPPNETLLDAGAKWGFINVDEDPDGFIRRYLLFQQDSQKKTYFPLSLYGYAALAATGNGAQRIKIDDDGDFVFGNRRIPKVDYHSMLINFRGPEGTFPTYSLTDVLDDIDYTLPNSDEDTDVFEFYKEEGLFSNQVVFIGASAKELQDNKYTPFFNYQGVRRKMPGVELHANALSTLLNGDAIRKQSAIVNFLAVLFLSFAAMFFTKWLKPFRGMFAVLALILLHVVAAIYFFINHLIWIQMTAPITAIILSFVANVLHQTLTEQRERIRIKKSWQQYMSKDVIENMLESGDLPKFGGERRDLTVLFSDIRGFTTFTEKHASNEVVEKLNEYLTEMVDVIFKHQGTLDKFVGDEIMAIYGAPHYFEHHAQKACETAIEMVRRLRALQKDWSQKNQDYFQIGIGINSGNVILGNLGSQQLFDYTVIGDDVNLGARLEGANKQYGTTIIISESTYREVKDKFATRELDSVRVKGKNRPVKIYELLGNGSLHDIEEELIIDTYTRGLNYYKEQNWYQALVEFKRVLSYFPTDGPTRVYIKRCLDFIETPPPEKWDGVYEFTTK